MTSLLQTAVDALSLGALYALIALGIALIFGVMQLVNFAHGEIIMVGGYVLWALAGAPLAVALFAAVAMTAAIGLSMERVAFRPVRGADATTLLVTSFALSFLLQNGALVLFGGRTKAVDISPTVTESVTIGDVRITKLAIITTVTTFCLLAALVAFLRRTSIGLQMRGAAEDFVMAQLVGVRSDTVVAWAFALSGILAGVVACLYVAQTGTVGPAMGLTPVIIGVVATVIGGLGSLVGAVLGAYVLGSLTIVLQAYLPLSLARYRDAFLYLLVIGILLVRPQGLVRGAQPKRV